ncbi:MAG: hypothetical protein OEZ09_09225 [Betaproteobacteria bacterium]|nr:hypothetical protein [Betaproteobacteria bacterium]
MLATLARRRAALVERSGLQRAELVAGVTGVRRALAEPLALGLAAAVALAGASPRLRAWLVRAWVVGALAKRLLR